jgi:hypothetical protein
MFYVVVIIIPLIIGLLSYLLTKKSDRFKWHLVRSLVKSLPYQYGYLFLVYILEMEEYIQSNWQFYSLGFFLIPISIVLLITHFVFNRKSSINA